MRVVAGEGLAVGDPAFTGEPDGDALGLGATLADAEGDGLATAGLFGAVLVFGSHALNTPTLAAKTVDNIKDLLIVFLLSISKNADKTLSAAQTSTAGLMRSVFLRFAAVVTTSDRHCTSTLRAIERRSAKYLQIINCE